MSTIAVMQPYLFPYLGYFHLMHAVDRFVILDDVAWINRGWITRNRLRSKAGVVSFTVPVLGASQNRRIIDLERGDDARWRRKFRRTIREAYRRAPQYERTAQLVDTVLDDPERHLATWLVRSLAKTATVLGFHRSVTPSAVKYDNASLRREERIIDICHREGASRYVNLIGGFNLYRAESFAARGVDLRFTRSRFPPYPQSGGAFVPGLSILDVLMFCDPTELAQQLSAYDLA